MSWHAYSFAVAKKRAGRHPSLFKSPDQKCHSPLSQAFRNYYATAHVSMSCSSSPSSDNSLQPLRASAIRNLQHSTKPNSSKAPSRKPALCFRKPACQKSRYWPWLPRDVRLQTPPPYQRRPLFAALARTTRRGPRKSSAWSFANTLPRTAPLSSLATGVEDVLLLQPIFSRKTATRAQIRRARATSCADTFRPASNATPRSHSRPPTPHPATVPGPSQPATL